ncbi:MAG: 50S ribosomal protein L13 [Bdellovibrionales bacterium]|jgi:large subunit ribosomal protein L13|nr:50S ribosomal protein L13 [Bdellovibrionales bacterium]
MALINLTSGGTYNAPKAGSENDVPRQWYVVDAANKSVGRIATEIARVLRGKHKPQFTPNQDTGDFVVVVNAEKVQMSGTKLDVKRYYRHSRFFGSLKSLTAREMLEKDPAFVIEDAVKGMLPKNKLSRSLLGKLKAYKGPNHPHAAQKPQALEIK